MTMSDLCDATDVVSEGAGDEEILIPHTEKNIVACFVLEEVF